MGWGLGLGAGASGFLPPTKHANRRSEDEKRFKGRLKVKESDHLLVVVVLFSLLRFLLLGVGMILLCFLRLLLFLLVAAIKARIPTQQ